MQRLFPAALRPRMIFGPADDESVIFVERPDVGRKLSGEKSGDLIVGGPGFVFISVCGEAAGIGIDDEDAA